MRLSQLESNQLTWVSGVIDEYNAALAASGRKANLLVFGLGHDWALWEGVNSKGRTAFVETSAACLHEVKSKHPAIEAYTTFSTTNPPGHYMAAPAATVTLPEPIQRTCWDIGTIRGRLSAGPFRCRQAT